MKNLLICCVLVLFMQTSPELPPRTLTKQQANDVVQQYNCSLEAIWEESKGESLLGQRAVMSVIYYRTKAKGFPSSFCEIVHQPKQFSYRNSLPKGKPFKTTVKPRDYVRYTQTQQIAFEAATGVFKPVLEDVLYYHNLSVKKDLKWNRKAKFVATIGNHKFYGG